MWPYSVQKHNGDSKKLYIYILGEQRKRTKRNDDDGGCERRQRTQKQEKRIKGKLLREEDERVFQKASRGERLLKQREGHVQI